MPEELRNALRDERARLGVTQGELAERVGVSRKTINTVENGVFVPSTVLAFGSNPARLANRCSAIRMNLRPCSNTSAFHLSRAV